MTIIQIDAGTLTASEENRTVTGLLVPYHEECASNLGKFTVAPGAFKVPADLAGMSLNVEHQRENVIGQPTQVRETDKGIVATFSVARTPEGDRALSDIKAGTRRSLSAEVADVIISAGRAVGGRLFAAALVERPAFPSATLLASAPNTFMGEEVANSTESDTFTDENGQVWRRVESNTTDVVVEEDGTQITTTTTVVEETPSTEEDTNEEEAPVGTVPNTLTAAQADATPASLSKVVSIIDGVKSGRLEGDTLLAALTDIKISGSGALPAAGVLQPAWLGELWNGRQYQRRYMTLITNGTIRALDEKGFRMTAGTELVSSWAGNKAAITSPASPTTAVESSILAKWAWAADIAREFFDLPGGEEVITAMLRAVAESYARVTDLWTLTQIVTAATANITAPDTYPTDYPTALGQLIQGISAVEDAGDTPTFAIVNQAAWSQMLYTPRDQLPEFINFAVATNGEASADGRVRVVRGDIGIANTPAVLVGARTAAHVNEQGGGSPIQLDALDIAKGGVDRAVVGYTQFMTDYPDALVLVGTADTP